MLIVSRMPYWSSVPSIRARLLTWYPTVASSKDAIGMMLILGAFQAAMRPPLHSGSSHADFTGRLIVHGSSEIAYVRSFRLKHRLQLPKPIFKT